MSERISVEDILNKLNPEQRAPVEDTEGAVLVIAGAGARSDQPYRLSCAAKGRIARQHYGNNLYEQGRERDERAACPYYRRRGQNVGFHHSQHVRKDPAAGYRAAGQPL